MQKSKVYFTNLRATPSLNLLQKLENLVVKAGIEQIDFNKKFTAIKLHFGEPGNIAYLRPNYSKVIVDIVKNSGGKPFLTDCNTLYTGRRKDALEHMDAAYENGYNPFALGCHIIIADGIKGTDEAYVPINCEFVKEAKIGRAIMDADIIISLNHFKGHELTGFGGAIKNIGMGAGSRAGKMEMHNSGKPSVRDSRCTGCKRCANNCAHGAINFNSNKKAYIEHKICVGCGRCIGACIFDAIHADWDEANEIVGKKIAEYAYAVLKDRPSFHINLVIDVSPFCDCHSENDAAIVPDIGMFASFDPVALDMACVDAVNKAPVNQGSMLGEIRNPSGDHFTSVHPETNWKIHIEHAEELGIGSVDYEIIEIQ
ncbi:MAG: DUF362 domain-containing protein [Synergistaceae bacterium]|nr:DUF362 domain-containing protein [Synergistaceae bacterium]